MSEVNGEVDLLRELVHLEGARKPVYPAVKVQSGSLGVPEVE